MTTVKRASCFVSITASLPHHREAPIKITLSFQNLEAAFSLVYLQAADPVARMLLFIPN